MVCPLSLDKSLINLLKSQKKNVYMDLRIRKTYTWSSVSSLSLETESQGTCTIAKIRFKVTSEYFPIASLDRASFLVYSDNRLEHKLEH